MTPRRSLLALLLLPLAALAGCAENGLHFPRPSFVAGNVTAWTEAVDVDLLARNGTEAPLWLRRLDLTLSAAGAPLALGVWEGDRQVDPGSAVLLGINLPLTEDAAPPPTDTPGDLTIRARYARSGVVGLLGGETHTFELPVVIRRGVETPPE